MASLPPPGAATFVGRAAELAALTAMLDGALAGLGGVALIAGEPGIGKTRLAERLAALADARGARVLWGHCYEGDPGTLEQRSVPAYWPWVQALRTLTRGRDPATLRDELGSGAADIAQLLPQLRALWPELPEPAALDPVQARFRLFDAVADFLGEVGRDQPLVLILDDLHWADAPSLLLLEYLAREVHERPLVLVGTYRDVDLGEGHPLHATLRALAHDPQLIRVFLEGLGAPEVAALIEQTTGVAPGSGIAASLVARTQGNPLFVTELLRLPSLKSALSNGEAVRHLPMPQTVREVIGHRLGALSHECNRALSVAAVAGQAFGVEVLSRAQEVTGAELLAVLEEAEAARVIEPVAGVLGGYRFSHALIRDALYEGIPSTRRIRMHRQVGVAMEEAYRADVDAHLVELAWHFVQAAPAGEGARAVAYAQRAAERAMQLYAYEEAARFYRMALEAVTVAAEVTPARRAELLCRLATAEALALWPEQALATVERALTALRASGAPPEAHVDFLRAVTEALYDAGAGDRTIRQLARQGLALLGERRDLQWARLTILIHPMERVRHGAFTARRWAGLDPDAVAIVRAQGDEQDIARTLYDVESAIREQTDRFRRLLRGWQQPPAILRGHRYVTDCLLYGHGDVPAAAEAAEEFVAAARRFRSVPHQGEALAKLASAQMALGEFAAARATLEQAQALAARIGPEHYLHASVADIPLQQAYYLDGDWSALVHAWQGAMGAPLWPRPPAETWASLAVDTPAARDEAQRLLRDLVPMVRDLGPAALRTNGAVFWAAAVVWELKAREHAETYESLALEHQAAGLGDYPHGCHDLAIAWMRTLGGNVSGATDAFARARARLRAGGRRPLQPIVDFHEAEALARRPAPDRARIDALLRAALPQFQALGMAGWVARTHTLLTSGRLVVGYPPRTRLPGGLTEREGEILRLLAGGRTSREIAERLVLSVPTVQNHVANIYRKIDVRSRSEATAYAIRHGLTDLPSSQDR